jgi:hypothetical protein
MKLKKIASQLAQLIERELNKQIDRTPGQEPNASVLTNDSFVTLFREWKITSGKPVIRYETEMMGAGPSLYVRLDRVVFAVLHNYDANPDGMNRFVMAVPLYVDVEKGGFIVLGVQEAPMEFIANAYEKLVEILADLHNASL